jgi:hypothetical protein
LPRTGSTDELYSGTCVDAVVVGIAAFLVTAPIVAHHFGIVAPVSMVAGDSPPYRS